MPPDVLITPHALTTNLLARLHQAVDSVVNKQAIFRFTKPFCRRRQRVFFVQLGEAFLVAWNLCRGLVELAERN